MASDVILVPVKAGATVFWEGGRGTYHGGWVNITATNFQNDGTAVVTWTINGKIHRVGLAKIDRAEWRES